MKKLDDITLDKSSDEFLYIQLYNNIKNLIVEKNIEPHTKLPTIRYLSKRLDVNNVTIVNAYNLLEQKGYVYKKVGSGTFVQDIFKDDNFSYKKLSIVEKEANVSDINREKIDIINFASTSPTPNLFPVEDIKTVLNEVLDRDGGKAFTYQESQGYYPLRNAIRGYLDEHNINTTEDNIQIISGAQQGIDILSKALVEYGDIVFTESPTYTGALAVFKSRSARIIEISIQEDGIDIKDLENKLRTFNPKFIYVVPNFQNPTGCSYSIEKKYELLSLAKKHNFYIIEDDYLSDLSFNDEKNETLKSIDTEDRVVYIKSFSKILMPGLRLAFMVIPTAIYNDVLSAKHISDISTSGLIQRAFDLYLRKGDWKKNLQRVNYIYKERFNIMIKSIKQYIPKDISYKLPNGGLSFWFSLPIEYSSNDLYEFCKKNNVIIAPGSAFNVDQSDNENFRLSISSLEYNVIEDGIKKMGSLLTQFLNEYKNKKNTIDIYNPFL
ncbi:transcriptional regulator, GntR family [Gottschalkia purinilytica]|uniref:Transcriptional regulator, GntR family n=1 Tax=Gottschalkia purinilytica TaxID=1503 RepID=A0A0L0WBR7_GOTPU|nr:PLP-dependent aminotransferase family protein [Gottschalkia purinilytica]KNF08948.1 transcriptional regulator, GntR family [Gottschalkia purinilytica]